MSKMPPPLLSNIPNVGLTAASLTPLQGKAHPGRSPGFLSKGYPSFTIANGLFPQHKFTRCVTQGCFCQVMRRRRKLRGNPRSSARPVPKARLIPASLNDFGRLPATNELKTDVWKSNVFSRSTQMLYRTLLWQPGIIYSSFAGPRDGPLLLTRKAASYETKGLGGILGQEKKAVRSFPDMASGDR